MGAFLDKPKTQKISEEGAGNGLVFGVACMQGWRIDMEDAHRIVFPLPGKLSKWSFFSIFDGHAGAKVAENAAKSLINLILEQDEFVRLQKDESLHTDKELIRKGIVQGFLKFDDKLLSDNKDEKSGSTAIAAFVTPHMIILANCGDSRAMVVSNGQVAVETMDHKPADPSETQRIQNAGGSVLLQRINGALAVSRALGDFDYKRNASVTNIQQLVIAEPDVTFFERKPAEDQLLVLACDGIWDVYTAANLKNYLLHRLKCVDSLAKATEQLLDHCLHLGSRDNMSAIIVGLDAYPRVDPETKEQDESLNKNIIALAEKFCRENKDSDPFTCNTIYELVEDSGLNLQAVPGGLSSKRYLIESVYNKYNSSAEESSGPDVLRLNPKSYELDAMIDPSQATAVENEDLA